MKSVIMAGGLGTRLRPLTDNIPKSLIPVGGRPVILYLIDSFSTVSRDYILTVSYKYEKIVELFSGKLSKKGNFLFSVEKDPLGTAGGLKKTEKFLEETFFVGNADTVFREDMKELLKFHIKNKNMITIGLTKVDNPSEFGVVKLRDGQIVQFQEKPKENPISNLANAGIYIMEPEIFDYIERGKVSDIAKNLIPALQDDNKKIGGYEIKGIWIDIGRPRDLIRANIEMSKKYTGKLPFNGNIYLGKKVKIGRNVIIKDSSIYDNVSISDNVSIENSVIYDNSQIGDGSKIKNSILSFNSILGEGVYVDDSVIGGGLLLRKGGKIEGSILSSGEENK